MRTPLGRELIAVATLNPFDDAVQSNLAQVVRHPAQGIVGWVEAQQLRHQGAHVQIREAPELQAECDEHCQEGLDARVAETQASGSLSVHLDRAYDLIEGVLPNRTIMRDFLDVQETPVGLEAHRLL